MLKVGIVGYGGIARGPHKSAWKSIENTEVVAVCDIRKERLDMAKEDFKRVSVYEDYKEMIDNEKLDIVDICTPNYLHSPVAVYALEKGMHVICEKPDAISVEDVLKMQAAQEASGKVLMAIRNNRYSAGSQYLKHIAKTGQAGEIYSGRCGWIRKRGIPGKGGWFTTKAESGGGPLIDLGVHMIDLAIYLMGNPKAVSVSGSTYSKFAENTEKADSAHATFGQAQEDGIYDVEDLAMGFIKFDNGSCLQIEFSWASNIKKETRFVQLRGTKKGLEFRDGIIDVFDGGKNTRRSKAKHNMEARKFESGIAKCLNAHEANIRHFVDVITKGVEPVFTVDQGVDMIKILMGIYESAKTGKEVVL